MSAKAEKTDFREGMRLGADDYLTKPFEDVQLLEAIEMRLKKNHGAANDKNFQDFHVNSIRFSF
jgi:DNA-binding response OmpR family regulator